MTRLVPRLWAEMDTAFPKRDPLIEGLLDVGGFSVVYGPSGARKSFFSFDQAAHVALGIPWRGRQVRQCGVLLIAPDAGVGLRERMAAWAKHHKIDLKTANVPLYVIAEPIDLCRSGDDANVVLKHIAKIIPEGIGLISVDTLSRALAGGDENSPRDMGAFVHHCDRLRSATRAHVSAVHHAGKDEGKGARGHSSLRAATDTEIEIIAHGSTSLATVTKQRDHETGGTFAFRLVSVDLGDGRSSCVPVAVDGFNGKKQTKRPPRLPSSAKIALEALAQAIIDDGKLAPASNHIPNGANTVTESLWRKYAYQRGISNGAERAKQRAFERGAEKLIAENIAGKWGELCWLA